MREFRKTGIHRRINLSIEKLMKKYAIPLAVKFPKIAAAYRYIRDNRRLLHEPKETPLGFKLIGNKAMENGVFESEETELVKRILPEVDIFINIGANIGYYCCIALQQGKFTVAVEPVSRNLHYLYKNMKANNWDNSIEISAKETLNL